MNDRRDADLELLRASLLLDADPGAAADGARRILEWAPDHEAATILLATACRRIGDPGRAVAILEPLGSAPEAPALLALELGRAYVAAGQLAEAAAAFERSVSRDQRLADGWRELAAARFAAGDPRGGDAAYARYAKLAPGPPQLADAAVALAEQRLGAAEALLRRELARSPGEPVAWRMLGEVALRREDYAAAEEHARAALARAPGDGSARQLLARALYLRQRSDEAMVELERLLAQDPGNAAILSLKAQVLRLLGRHAEALALVESIVAAEPTLADAWLQLGNLCREAGAGERAIAAYRRALDLKPDCGEAYWSLANLKTFRFRDEERARMAAELGRTALLGSDRIPLEFALGKALEDAGEYAGAFEHYARGNALKRATFDFDPEGVHRDVARSQAVFSAAFFADRAGWGAPQADPIFIVGLPRSGSTLVEQILASQSAVEGTSELADLPAIAQQLLARSPGSGWPEPVAALTREDCARLGAEYLERTRVHRPLGRPRFVDKMLPNFGLAGFIHLLLPRATIIDVRRHPMACGFSCFKQLFARGVPFSYDLGEIGRYYRDYAELMEHFDRVLPGRVHRLHYEQLVADPETEVRRLLAHCGLEFEPGCLRFYETRRAVLTVSSEQVRQPVYGDAVDQWQHFEPWLGPLKAALGALAAAPAGGR
ncbi:MAG: sulfotransferase [Proteobacteria bacterium]|nr:sulfotransferase [Pseudomonadota bacterium]